MEAKAIFDFILKQVETSPLNFAVSKTPFLASISLKCSFATRFKSSGTENAGEISNCDSLKISPVKDKDVPTEDAKIAKLNSNIKGLVNAVENQQMNLK